VLAYYISYTGKTPALAPLLECCYPLDKLSESMTQSICKKRYVIGLRKREFDCKEHYIHKSLDAELQADFSCINNYPLNLELLTTQS